MFWLASGTNSTPQGSNGNRNETLSHHGPLDTDQGATESRRKSRQKWTSEEYKQVMEAYYTASLNPSHQSVTKETYQIWREKNPSTRMNLDYNKLANVRRDIEKQKRLSEKEILEIKKKVMEGTPKQDGVNNHDKDTSMEERASEEARHGDESASVRRISEEDTNFAETTGEVSLRNDILIKWQEIKYLSVEERPQLPKLNKTKKVIGLIDRANKALDEIRKTKGELNVSDINQLYYATATVITEHTGLRQKKRRIKKKQPSWKERMMKTIQKKRKDLSVLAEISLNRLSDRKRKNIMAKYSINTVNKIPEVMEQLKQQIQAKAQRMRRFEKRSSLLKTKCLEKTPRNCTGSLEKSR